MSRRPRKSDEIVTAFRDGQVTLRTNRRTGGFTFAEKEIGYQGVRRGDLVIHAMDAFAGAIGVSDSDGKSSPVYSVLRPQGKAEPRFYAYLLRTMAGCGFIASLARGIRERSTDFRYATFRELQLPVPPTVDQVAIADFLDRKTAAIDALIAKKERLIELLEEKRQALITQAVTKGLDPNVPMKDSGIEWLGEIPAHWIVAPLRRILRRIEQGWSPSCDSHRAEPGQWGVLKAGCTADGRFDASEHKALPPTLHPRSAIEVHEGDLIMSRASGSPHIVGTAAIVHACPWHLMLSDKLFRLHLSDETETSFVWLALGSRPAREQIELLISGAEGLANNLPQARLREVVVAIPPQQEQAEIARVVQQSLSQAQSTEGTLARSIATLREYRQAVITAAVTGQLDVSEAS